eukprot:5171554-Amphidinium_carterae.1
MESAQTRTPPVNIVFLTMLLPGTHAEHCALCTAGWTAWPEEGGGIYPSVNFGCLGHDLVVQY